ncbi:MAG: electron transfer flavoprotein subunit alpha/FixB family protein [Chloroflexota bacterium]
MAMTSGVLVAAEIAADGSLRPISWEMISAGRAAGGPVTAVVFGPGAGARAAELAAAGPDRVLAVDDARIHTANPEAAASVICAAQAACGAGVILMPGTTAGRDYAPKVAARLGAPLAADCIAFAAEDGGLAATRSVLGGRANSVVTVAGPVRAATVRAGSFARAAAGAGAAQVESLAVDFRPGDFRTSVAGTEAKSGGATALDGADVVVAGGRGLKEAANFRLVEDLAAAFGGAVGATRAVVDAGWRQHHEQIGQTGRSVTPKLYIAVGVSGAVQHNVGMQGSDIVVAINRDPDAPIFKLAHFGIVGDLFEVVPALAAEVRASRA